MSRIEKLLEFLQTSGEDSFLQHALALEYVKIGNEEAAKGLFTAILKREPSYIGSYYHLGKLYERLGESGQAIQTYQKGMDMARLAGDNHSYYELQMALEDIDD